MSEATKIDTKAQVSDALKGFDISVDRAKESATADRFDNNDPNRADNKAMEALKASITSFLEAGDAAKLEAAREEIKKKLAEVEKTNSNTGDNRFGYAAVGSLSKDLIKALDAFEDDKRATLNAPKRLETVNHGDLSSKLDELKIDMHKATARKLNNNNGAAVTEANEATTAFIGAVKQLTTDTNAKDKEKIKEDLAKLAAAEKALTEKHKALGIDVEGHFKSYLLTDGINKELDKLKANAQKIVEAPAAVAAAEPAVAAPAAAAIVTTANDATALTTALKDKLGIDASVDNSNGSPMLVFKTEGKGAALQAAIVGSDELKGSGSSRTDGTFAVNISEPKVLAALTVLVSDEKTIEAVKAATTATPAVAAEPAPTATATTTVSAEDKQKALAALKYDIGKFGAKKDGIDGKDGAATQQAWRDAKVDVSRITGTKFADLDDAAVLVALNDKETQRKIKAAHDAKPHVNVAIHREPVQHTAAKSAPAVAAAQTDARNSGVENDPRRTDLKSAEKTSSVVRLSPLPQTNDDKINAALIAVQAKEANAAKARETMIAQAQAAAKELDSRFPAGRHSYARDFDKAAHNFHENPNDENARKTLQAQLAAVHARANQVASAAPANSSIAIAAKSLENNEVATAFKSSGSALTAPVRPLDVTNLALADGITPRVR